MYQKLPSLKESVVVAQDARLIESWRRHGARKWVPNTTPFSSQAIEVPPRGALRVSSFSARAIPRGFSQR